MCGEPLQHDLRLRVFGTEPVRAHNRQICIGRLISRWQSTCKHTFQLVCSQSQILFRLSKLAFKADQAILTQINGILATKAGYREVSGTTSRPGTLASLVLDDEAAPWTLSILVLGLQAVSKKPAGLSSCPPRFATRTRRPMWDLASVATFDSARRGGQAGSTPCPEVGQARGSPRDRAAMSTGFWHVVLGANFPPSS